MAKAIQKNVVPFGDLNKIANSIAQTQNVSGALVVTFTDNSICMGASFNDLHLLVHLLNMTMYQCIKRIEESKTAPEAS